MNGKDREEAPKGGGHEVVQINIDQKPYESPNPTSGSALYALGRVKAGMKLYRGSNEPEDAAIDDGPETIRLRPGEHFRSLEPRGYVIIVEGTKHEWPEPTISFKEVVVIFDPAYAQHPEVTYAITYDHGPRQNPEGILSPGASVRIQNRMVFHVSPTGQS